MNQNFIAKNLRFLRQKNGYSLEDVAESIVVSRQTVGKWESGETVPDIINCMKLATLYQISLDRLVNLPLADMASSELLIKKGKVCGVIDIDEKCRISIPSQVLSLFDLHAGDKMLLLADISQGIALIKCDQFGEEI